MTITNSRNKASHRNLFKNLYIFTIMSQYIFSLLSFVITNRKQYIINLNILGRNTKQGSNVHQTISNWSLYQRGSYHMRTKFFNRLPTYTKDMSYIVKEFKLLS